MIPPEPGMIENINLNLLSGGFFQCNPAWSRPANSLDRCYKIYFPVSGRARLEMATGVFEVRSGRVYFISGFQLRQQNCPAQMKVFWLHFVPESLYLRHALDQLPPLLSWSRATGWPAASYADIRRIFEHPFHELNQLRGDLTAAMVCRIYALLLNVVGHCLENMDKVTARDFHPDFYRLKPTLDFMQQHYRDNLKLARMATLAGMAPNYFHRRFKLVFGVTPLEHIVGQRLNQARHLLASTRLSIKEIADAVGYRDPLYFTRIFSHHLHMSPTKYRAAHQFNSVHKHQSTA